MKIDYNSFQKIIRKLIKENEETSVPTIEPATGMLGNVEQRLMSLKLSRDVRERIEQALGNGQQPTLEDLSLLAAELVLHSSSNTNMGRALLFLSRYLVQKDTKRYEIFKTNLLPILRRLNVPIDQDEKYQTADKSLPKQQSVQQQPAPKPVAQQPEAQMVSESRRRKR